MLIPLVSTAVALDAAAGPARRHRPARGLAADAPRGQSQPRLDAWARMRRAPPLAWRRALAVAILAALIVPFFSLTTGETSASALARHRARARRLRAAPRAGVCRAGCSRRSKCSCAPRRRAAVRARLAAVPGMARRACSPAAPDSNRARHQRSSSASRARRPSTRTRRSAVGAARNALRRPPGGDRRSPATGPTELDYQHAVFGNFPLMFALIALLTFVLLARAFRSVVLAVKAVVLNLISMAAAFGCHDLVLAGGPRLAGALRHPRHRRDHVLGAAHGLRLPVRAFDGLRGLHPRPRARGVRPHRLHRRGVIAGLGAPGAW